LPLQSRIGNPESKIEMSQPDAENGRGGHVRTALIGSDAFRGLDATGFDESVPWVLLLLNLKHRKHTRTPF
jgi:hypothetical protein